MLCRATLIMTRSPIFKRCDIWKTQSHFGFLLSLEGGYREITGPTLTTCSTSHPLPPRNDGDQKIGVLLSQSARRTVTMGSPYLVVISRFLRLGHCSGYYRGRWGEPEDTAFIFFKDGRQEEREKEKKGLKCFTSCRALSLQWPLVGGQIDPENKGSFPPPVYLLAAHCHQSETHTLKLTQLYPQRANVRQGQVTLVTVTTSKELMCIGSPRAATSVTSYWLNFIPLTL